MKKKLFAIILIFIVLISFNTTVISADETVSYPFDSITIKSAFKFEALCEEEPSENSYLYEKVNAGETIFLYVGKLEFSSENNTSDSSIVIITNESDEDIASWIINGGGYDANTGIENMSFSSHITVDPTFGIRKNLNNFTYTAEISRNTQTNECVFIAKNWDGTQYGVYNMTAGTFEELTDLDIIISAYEGE